jgi:hypothetical protein
MLTVRSSPSPAEPIWGLPIPRIDDLFPPSGDGAASEQNAALKARYFNRLAGVVDRWRYPEALAESLSEFFDYWAATYLGRVANSNGLQTYDAILRTYADLLIQRGKEETATFAQIHYRKKASTILTGAGEGILQKYGMLDCTSNFVAEELQTRLRKRHRYWLAVAAVQAISPGPKPSPPALEAATDTLVEDRASPVVQNDPARKAIMEALDAGKREEAVRLWQKRTEKTKTDLYKAARVHHSDYYKWERGLLPETSVKHVNLRRELLSD